MRCNVTHEHVSDMYYVATSATIEEIHVLSQIKGELASTITREGLVAKLMWGFDVTVFTE